MGLLLLTTIMTTHFLFKYWEGNFETSWKDCNAGQTISIHLYPQNFDSARKNDVKSTAMTSDIGTFIIKIY